MEGFNVLVNLVKLDDIQRPITKIERSGILGLHLDHIIVGVFAEDLVANGQDLFINVLTVECLKSFDEFTGVVHGLGGLLPNLVVSFRGGNFFTEKGHDHQRSQDNQCRGRSQGFHFSNRSLIQILGGGLSCNQSRFGLGQGGLSCLFDLSGLSGGNIGLLFFDIGGVLLDGGDGGFFSDPLDKGISIGSLTDDIDHGDLKVFLEAFDLVLSLSQNIETLFISLDVGQDFISLNFKNVFVEFNQLQERLGGGVIVTTLSLQESFVSSVNGSMGVGHILGKQVE